MDFNVLPQIPRMADAKLSLCCKGLSNSSSSLSSQKSIFIFPNFLKIYFFNILSLCQALFFFLPSLYFYALKFSLPKIRALDY